MKIGDDAGAMGLKGSLRLTRIVWFSDTEGNVLLRYPEFPVSLSSIRTSVFQEFSGRLQLLHLLLQVTFGSRSVSARFVVIIQVWIPG